MLEWTGGYFDSPSYLPLWLAKKPLHLMVVKYFHNFVCHFIFSFSAPATDRSGWEWRGGRGELTQVEYFDNEPPPINI